MIAVYAVYLRTRIALQVQYRVAALIWLLSLFIPTIVTMVVWSTVAGAGSVHGYTAGQFIAYFLVAMLVDHCTFSWVMWDFEFQVRQGTLSPQLLKPLHPIHASIADNAGYKAATLAVVLPGMVVLSLLFHPTWQVTVTGFLLFLPSLALAVVLRFLVEYTLALAGFWTTRIGAINDLYTAVLLFLSGLWVPLAVLPGPLRAVAQVLPFRAMVSFPTEVVLGRTIGRDIVNGLILQVAWTLAAFSLFLLVWRRGIRAYSAVGA